MPDLPNTQSNLQTTDQVYQQTTTNISDQLTQAIGGSHDIIPTTPESEPEGDSLGEFKDRVVFNRPGKEPSRSFLRKFIERLTKKYPNSDIKLK